MNTLFSKIFPLIEYISWGRILFIFKEDISLALHLIELLNTKDEDMVIMRWLSNFLEKKYILTGDLAWELANEIFRIYKYILGRMTSEEEIMNGLETIFYIFSKRFPTYYKNGIIYWWKLYRDLPFFDMESRELRALIKQLPLTIESLKQDASMGADLVEVLRKIEIGTFGEVVIKAVTLFPIWKFIKVINT